MLEPPAYSESEVPDETKEWRESHEFEWEAYSVLSVDEFIEEYKEVLPPVVKSKERSPGVQAFCEWCCLPALIENPETGRYQLFDPESNTFIDRGTSDPWEEWEAWKAGAGQPFVRHIQETFPLRWPEESYGGNWPKDNVFRVGD